MQVLNILANVATILLVLVPSALWARKKATTYFAEQKASREATLEFERATLSQIVRLHSIAEDLEQGQQARDAEYNAMLQQVKSLQGQIDVTFEYARQVEKSVKLVNDMITNLHEHMQIRNGLDSETGNLTHEMVFSISDQVLCVMDAIADLAENMGQPCATPQSAAQDTLRKFVAALAEARRAREAALLPAPGSAVASSAA